MKHSDNYFDVFERLKGADVTVWRDRCVLVRNRHAGCRRCVDACTSGCISLNDGRVEVAPENCIGCGTCASVCPTGALEARGPDDRELYEACAEALRASGEEATVAVACAQACAGAGIPGGARVVEVACLGRVEESLLVLLARAGARDVALVHGACETCPHSPGSLVANEVCATANVLLRAWGRPEVVRVVDALPEILPYGQATGAVGEGGAADAEGALDAEAANDVEHAGDAGETEMRPAFAVQRVQADGTLPHHLPHRRNRLLKGLAHFGTPQDSVVATRLWGRVSIDAEACTSCQACAVFCPTEAIRKFKDDDGTFGVYHYPYRCVKCRCCVDICPAGAINLSDEVGTSDLTGRTRERFEMAPRKVKPGPHQMRDALASILGSEYIYER